MKRIESMQSDVEINFGRGEIRLLLCARSFDGGALSNSRLFRRICTLRYLAEQLECSLVIEIEPSLICPVVPISRPNVVGFSPARQSQRKPKERVA